MAQLLIAQGTTEQFGGWACVGMLAIVVIGFCFCFWVVHKA